MYLVLDPQRADHERMSFSLGNRQLTVTSIRARGGKPFLVDDAFAARLMKFNKDLYREATPAEVEASRGPATAAADAPTEE